MWNVRGGVIRELGAVEWPDPLIMSLHLEEWKL